MKPNRLLGRRPVNLVPLRFRGSGEKSQKAKAPGRALNDSQRNADSESTRYSPVSIVRKILKRGSATSKRSAGSMETVRDTSGSDDDDMMKSKTCRNLHALVDPHDRICFVPLPMEQRQPPTDQELCAIFDPCIGRIPRRDLDAVRRRLDYDDPTDSEPGSPTVRGLLRESSLETIQLEDEETLGLDISDEADSPGGVTKWSLLNPYPLARNQHTVRCT